MRRADLTDYVCTHLSERWRTASELRESIQEETGNEVSIGLLYHVLNQLTKEGDIKSRYRTLTAEQLAARRGKKVTEWTLVKQRN